MSLKEIVPPAELYVNLFLIEMLQADKAEHLAKASVALPVLQGNEPPDFARFRNRLKIMAGLDPVTYATARSGTANFAIDRQVAGQWCECVYTLRLIFNDSISDPSVELCAELKSQKPGIDPDLCLD
jgi:hypothetical protein